MDDYSPIFIHSLFRSASTWIFQRFREAGGGRFWCYQEPFHESLIQLNDAPESLLDFSQETAVSLRHPHMTTPYFQEFVEIKKALAGKFEKCISYDSFFDANRCPAWVSFTESLISSARGIPVLQCCRSFGRVTALKETFSGVHLLLWRKPRSQWLSYQINDYFDTTSLLIVNATNTPRVIQKIREEIGFSEFHSDSVKKEFLHFSAFPLAHHQRYLLFYSLWLYYLIENLPLCDIPLQMDALGASEKYTQECTAKLLAHDIQGVDLSECQLPVIALTDDETNWFEAIENRAEQLFAEAGYPPERIEHVRNLKQNDLPPGPSRSPNALLESARRARAMAWRYADRWADSERRAQDLQSRLTQAETERDALRNDVEHARDEAYALRRENLGAQAAREKALADMENAHHAMDEARAAEHRARAETHHAKARLHEQEAGRLQERLKNDA